MEEDRRLELRLAPPGDDHQMINGQDDNSNAVNGAKRAFNHSWSSSAIKRETNNGVNKRMEVGRVVGWPPVRSFRRNLAGNGWSKPPSESADKTLKEENVNKKNDQMLVKINMEGVPIGRKVNLSTCNSYEQLSRAIDKLFRGLLAAQMGSSVDDDDDDDKKVEEENTVESSLGSGGEYTLVYEDNEGDRVLVGDVPWHMFISTVKRLRVLKTSPIPTRLGSDGQERGPPDSVTETGKTRLSQGGQSSSKQI